MILGDFFCCTDATDANDAEPVSWEFDGDSLASTGSGLSSGQQLEFDDTGHVERVEITGTRKKVNGAPLDGVYVMTSASQNRKPLYQKIDDVDMWLRYNPRGEWIISPTTCMMANDNSGWVYSDEKNLEHPIAASSWKVFQNQVWTTKVRPAQAVFASS